MIALPRRLSDGDRADQRDSQFTSQPPHLLRPRLFLASQLRVPRLGAAIQCRFSKPLDSYKGLGVRSGCRVVFTITDTAAVPRLGPQRTFKDPRHGRAENDVEFSVFLFSSRGVSVLFRSAHPTTILANPGIEILALNLKPSAGISRASVEPGPALGLHYFYGIRFERMDDRRNSHVSRFNRENNMLSSNIIIVHKTPALIDRVELVIYNDQLLPYCTHIRPDHDLMIRVKRNELPWDGCHGYHLSQSDRGVDFKQYLGLQKGIKRRSYGVVLTFNANKIVRKQLIEEGHYNSRNDFSLNGDHNYIDSRRLIGITMKDVCQRQAKLIHEIAIRYCARYPQMVKSAFGVEPTGVNIAKIRRIEFDWDIPTKNARQLLELMTAEIRQHFGPITTEEKENCITKKAGISKGKSVGIYPKTLTLLRMEARITGSAIRAMELRPEIGTDIGEVVTLLRDAFEPFRQSFLGILRNSARPADVSAVLDFITLLPRSMDPAKNRHFVELLIHNGRIKRTPFSRYQIQAALSSGIVIPGARGYVRAHPRYNTALAELRRLNFQPKQQSTSNTVERRGTLQPTTNQAGGPMCKNPRNANVPKMERCL